MGGIKESEIEVINSGKGMEAAVMDTPDKSKTQIATPISKSEDSPVFNFLNNLSPIMAAKSVPVTQNMNAHSFTSPPSVFTSPHVSSLKELRFLRRHQVSDPWKPEFSSYSESKTMTDAGIMDTVCNDNEQQKIVYPDNSFDEVSVEKPRESSKPTVGIVQNSNYDCSSPVCQTNTSCYSEILPFSKFAANSREVVPFDQLVRGNGLYGNEACTAEQSPGNESGGATCCDWEAISDVTDLLTFDSPMDVDTSKRSHDPATGYYNDITNDLQNVQPLRSVGFAEYSETNNPSTEPGEGSYREDLAEMQDILADSSPGTNCVDGNFEQNMNIEPTSHLYHGVRRRCLDFEISGAPRKQLDENSSSISPIFTPSGEETPAYEKQLVPRRTTKDSKCILPVIGLHLNALATNLKEYKCVTQNSSVSGRVGISLGPTTNFHSSKAGQEQQNDSLEIICRDTDPGENEFLLLEDAGHSSVHIENEDMNQSSPKRKRRRLEEAAEAESACKRCNCKKSKCLKLYCECFAAGVYCVEPCACRECFNKPIHEETVLATRKQIESRNPLAFAPKVIRSSDSQAEAGDDSSKTPASARHKRGCNCKKSGCLKKYCECYQGGVGCSINCRCEGCKNAFGRKDGSAFMGPETEVEENEIDTMEKSVMDRESHKAAVQTDGENTESVQRATPFQFKRPSVQPSFSSNKPPRSSTSIIGTSSLFPIKGLIGRTDFLPPPPPKFDDKHFETVSEDEMPDILKGNGSPVAGVKSSSPNSKRVSPPHSNFGMSPNRRSSRKLILQSIPSFPSLTPKR